LTVGNRHFRDVLIAKGYDVTYRETGGAHNNLHFRAMLADALLTLLPGEVTLGAATVPLDHESRILADSAAVGPRGSESPPTVKKIRVNPRKSASREGQAHASSVPRVELPRCQRPTTTKNRV
jgi:hypothetical protein